RGLSRRRLVQTAAVAGVAVTLPAAARLTAAQKRERIAFSVPGLNFPFFVHMVNLAKAHADQLGIDLVVLDGQQGGQPSSTQPGASPAIDRHKGLDNVISKQDKVKVIVSQPADFQRAKATQVFESALAGNPPPDAVVAANDEMAFGASEVAQANGLNVPIIGF